MLAAGFVIGPGGDSIREISSVSGADIQSRTVLPEEGCKRACRDFVIEGTPTSVLSALTVICQAVDRYKSLCEGQYAGKVTARIQRINGIEFTYQPPPRSAAPFAAQIKSTKYKSRCSERILRQDNKLLMKGKPVSSALNPDHQAFCSTLRSPSEQQPVVQNSLHNNSHLSISYPLVPGEAPNAVHIRHLRAIAEGGLQQASNPPGFVDRVCIGQNYISPFGADQVVSSNISQRLQQSILGIPKNVTIGDNMLEPEVCLGVPVLANRQQHGIDQSQETGSQLLSQGSLDLVSGPKRLQSDQEHAWLSPNRSFPSSHRCTFEMPTPVLSPFALYAGGQIRDCPDNAPQHVPRLESRDIIANGMRMDSDGKIGLVAPQLQEGAYHFGTGSPSPLCCSMSDVSSCHSAFNLQSSGKIGHGRLSREGSMRTNFSSRQSSMDLGFGNGCASGAEQGTPPQFILHGSEEPRILAPSLWGMESHECLSGIIGELDFSIFE